ncbi:RHS repeat protein, partial [Mediterraneibacter faecis]
ETVDALGQKETYTYDKKGQLLGKLDKEGYLTKYAYTKQGDLSGIQYADGKEVKLSYNPLRQLIEIQDWLGSTRITPDALGRAEKVQY